MTTEVTKKDPKPMAPANRLATMIESAHFKAEAEKALGKLVPTEQWIRAVMTCVRKMPALANCEPASVAQALMDCATFGLVPGSAFGLAHLVPFGRECTLIVDYKGFIECAWRSAKILIRGDVVYKDDAFQFELGMEEKLVHRPNYDGSREDKDIIGAYAVATMPDGRKQPFYISRKEIDALRKVALAKKRSGKPSPWETNFPPMCVKSAVRRLWKFIPKTPDMIHLAEKDLDNEMHLEASFTKTDEAAGRDALRDLTGGNDEPPAEDQPQDESPSAGAAKAFHEKLSKLSKVDRVKFCSKVMPQRDPENVSDDEAVDLMTILDGGEWRN